MASAPNPPGVSKTNAPLLLLGSNACQESPDQAHTSAAALRQRFVSTAHAVSVACSEANQLWCGATGRPIQQASQSIPWPWLAPGSSPASRLLPVDRTAYVLSTADPPHDASHPSTVKVSQALTELEEQLASCEAALDAVGGCGRLPESSVVFGVGGTSLTAYTPRVAATRVPTRGSVQVSYADHSVTQFLAKALSQHIPGVGMVFTRAQPVPSSNPAKAQAAGSGPDAIRRQPLAGPPSSAQVKMLRSRILLEPPVPWQDVDFSRPQLSRMALYSCILQAIRAVLRATLPLPLKTKDVLVGLVSSSDTDRSSAGEHTPPNTLVPVAAPFLFPPHPATCAGAYAVVPAGLLTSCAISSIVQALQLQLQPLLAWHASFRSQQVKHPLSMGQLPAPRSSCARIKWDKERCVWRAQARSQPEGGLQELGFFSTEDQAIDAVFRVESLAGREELVQEVQSPDQQLLSWLAPAGPPDLAFLLETHRRIAAQVAISHGTYDVASVPATCARSMHAVFTDTLIHALTSSLGIPMQGPQRGHHASADIWHTVRRTSKPVEVRQLVQQRHQPFASMQLGQLAQAATDSAKGACKLPAWALPVPPALLLPTLTWVQNFWKQANLVVTKPATEAPFARLACPQTTKEAVKRRLAAHLPQDLLAQAQSHGGAGTSEARVQEGSEQDKLPLAPMTSEEKAALWGTLCVKQCSVTGVVSRAMPPLMSILAGQHQVWSPVPVATPLLLRANSQQQVALTVQLAHCQVLQHVLEAQQAAPAHPVRELAWGCNPRLVQGITQAGVGSVLDCLPWSASVAQGVLSELIMSSTLHQAQTREAQPAMGAESSAVEDTFDSSNPFIAEWDEFDCPESESREERGAEKSSFASFQLTHLTHAPAASECPAAAARTALPVLLPALRSLQNDQPDVSALQCAALPRHAVVARAADRHRRLAGQASAPAKGSLQAHIHAKLRDSSRPPAPQMHGGPPSTTLNTTAAAPATPSTEAALSRLQPSAMPAHEAAQAVKNQPTDLASSGPAVVAAPGLHTYSKSRLGESESSAGFRRTTSVAQSQERPALPGLSESSTQHASVNAAAEALLEQARKSLPKVLQGPLVPPPPMTGPKYPVWSTSRPVPVSSALPVADAETKGARQSVNRTLAALAYSMAAREWYDACVSLPAQAPIARTRESDGIVSDAPEATGEEAGDAGEDKAASAADSDGAAADATAEQPKKRGRKRQRDGTDDNLRNGTCGPRNWHMLWRYRLGVQGLGDVSDSDSGLHRRHVAPSILAFEEALCSLHGKSQGGDSEEAKDASAPALELIRDAHGPQAIESGSGFDWLVAALLCHSGMTAPKARATAVHMRRGELGMWSSALGWACSTERHPVDNRMHRALQDHSPAAAAAWEKLVEEVYASQESKGALMSREPGGIPPSFADPLSVSGFEEDVMSLLFPSLQGCSLAGGDDVEMWAAPLLRPQAPRATCFLRGRAVSFAPNCGKPLPVLPDVGPLASVLAAAQALRLLLLRSAAGAGGGASAADLAERVLASQPHEVPVDRISFLKQAMAAVAFPQTLWPFGQEPPLSAEGQAGLDASVQSPPLGLTPLQLEAIRKGMHPRTVAGCDVAQGTPGFGPTLQAGAAELAGLAAQVLHEDPVSALRPSTWKGGNAHGSALRWYLASLIDWLHSLPGHARWLLCVNLSHEVSSQARTSPGARGGQPDVGGPKGPPSNLHALARPYDAVALSNAVFAPHAPLLPASILHDPPSAVLRPEVQRAVDKQLRSRHTEASARANVVPTVIAALRATSEKLTPAVLQGAAEAAVLQVSKSLPHEAGPDAPWQLPSQAVQVVGTLNGDPTQCAGCRTGKPHECRHKQVRCRVMGDGRVQSPIESAAVIGERLRGRYAVLRQLLDSIGCSRALGLASSQTPDSPTLGAAVDHVRCRMGLGVHDDAVAGSAVLPNPPLLQGLCMAFGVPWPGCHPSTQSKGGRPITFCAQLLSCVVDVLHGREPGSVLFGEPTPPSGAAQCQVHAALRASLPKPIAHTVQSHAVLGCTPANEDAVFSAIAVREAAQALHASSSKPSPQDSPLECEAGVLGSLVAWRSAMAESLLFPNEGCARAEGHSTWLQRTRLKQQYAAAPPGVLKLPEVYGRALGTEGRALASAVVPAEPHAKRRAVSISASSSPVPEASHPGWGSGYNGVISLDVLSRRARWSVGSLKMGRSSIDGAGLYATRPVPLDDVVAEYVGEIVSGGVCELREGKYGAAGVADYMFRIGQHEAIDASVFGGRARYINHSCDPNCYAVATLPAVERSLGKAQDTSKSDQAIDLWAEGQVIPPAQRGMGYAGPYTAADPTSRQQAASLPPPLAFIGRRLHSRARRNSDRRRVFVYAGRAIAPGQELTYDYQFPYAEKLATCKCGTPACRGTLNNTAVDEE